MKKRIIIIIVLIILICILFLVFNFKVKEFEIVKDTNGGVPYRWEFEIEDKDIVEFVKVKDISVNKDKTISGGKIKKHYIFKALKKGKTNITFKYVSVNKVVSKIVVYDISVDKNLKVSIKEKDKDTHFDIVETKNKNLDCDWNVEIEDEKVVKLISSNEEEGNDIVDVTYKFNALKEGSTSITFTYKNSNKVEETKKYNVIIDKDMNINILEE